LIKTSIINRIDKDHLCLGCGLCESVCGKENVEMKLRDDGFFHPNIKVIEYESEQIIKRICPGINIVNDLPFNKSESTWGKIEKLYSGFSTDKEIRSKGSSGGMVSGLAIYLLERNIVDAILQVGGDINEYKHNCLRISRTRADVMECASSRYAPALVFTSLLEILNNSTDLFCFVGKPCDISALKNLLIAFPKYKGRFKLTISIICAGMPSFCGTQKIIDDFQAIQPVNNLVYRGNGWPGNFSFKDKKGEAFKMSYNDSWGKVLGKFVHFRCKICPDGVGLQADIVVGDAWETKNGYPDFTEREGQSLIIARTLAGQTLLVNAKRDHLAMLRPLDIGQLPLIQPFQYNRRQRVGIRILAFSLARQKMLNFKKMQILNNLTSVNPLLLVKDFVGTFKRIICK
jgi:coenzyme F420 hydrogenase subunit beta